MVPWLENLKEQKLFLIVIPFCIPLGITTLVSIPRIHSIPPFSNGFFNKEPTFTSSHWISSITLNASTSYLRILLRRLWEQKGGCHCLRSIWWLQKMQLIPSLGEDSLWYLVRMDRNPDTRIRSSWMNQTILKTNKKNLLKSISELSVHLGHQPFPQHLPAKFSQVPEGRKSLW